MCQFRTTKRKPEFLCIRSSDETTGVQMYDSRTFASPRAVFSSAVPRSYHPDSGPQVCNEIVMMEGSEPVKSNTQRTRRPALQAVE